MENTQVDFVSISMKVSADGTTPIDGVSIRAPFPRTAVEGAYALRQDVTVGYINSSTDFDIYYAPQSLGATEGRLKRILYVAYQFDEVYGKTSFARMSAQSTMTQRSGTLSTTWGVSPGYNWIYNHIGQQSSDTSTPLYQEFVAYNNIRDDNVNLTQLTWNSEYYFGLAPSLEEWVIIKGDPSDTRSSQVPAKYAIATTPSAAYSALQSMSGTPVSPAPSDVGGGTLSDPPLPPVRTTVSGSRVFNGSAGPDWVEVSGIGSSLQIGAVETLIGSAGDDFVTLLGNQNNIILTAVETLIGSAGQDWVDLGNRGNTLILAAVETLVGGAGQDWVNLGNRGNTMILAAIETLVGGAGMDAIALGNRGNTLILAGIEALSGGAGQDLVMLGNRGNAMAIADIDIIVGGSSGDHIWVNHGPVQFDGRGGADHLELQSGANADLVLYGSVDDGTRAGMNSGFDVVDNFQTGTDKIAIVGALRTLVDKNGDGALSSGELRMIGQPIAALTDDGYASFRSALGAVALSANTLVVASDGYSSGLYVVSDGGDGAVSANEVRMLGVFSGISVSAMDIYIA